MWGSVYYSNSVVVKLNADGSVSGSKTGTWTFDKNYITIKIGDETFKGVVFEQTMEDKNLSKAMVFTAVGDGNIKSVWGVRVKKPDAEIVSYDASKITVEKTIKKDFALTTEGFFGSEVTWTSDNAAIKIEGKTAKVTRALTDTTVKLTAVIKHGTVEQTKEFTVTVPALEIVIKSVVRGDHIDLPATIEGNAITWSSSNSDVINVNGTVTPPSSGSVTVKLTATIGTVTKEFDVVVLPETITDFIYQNDYSSAEDDKNSDGTKIGAGGWESANAPNQVTVETDSTHGKYIQFAPGQQNSRGAFTNFGIEENKVNGVYCVEFDLSLKAGDNQTTEFALTGTDHSYKINDGITAGYILKMAATNSTKWSINGSPEVDIPASWVHVLAVVNASQKTATIEIKDDTKTYFQGPVEINGTGVLKGMYVRGGRYNSVTMIDNIQVY